MICKNGTFLHVFLVGDLMVTCTHADWLTASSLSSVDATARKNEHACSALCQTVDAIAS